MFATLAIVAFVLLIVGLTAFVPKFRNATQWFFKKALLVLIGLVLAFYRLVVGLVVMAFLLVFGVLLCFGKLLVKAGKWGVDTFVDIDEANEKQIVRIFTGALKRL